MQRDRTRATGLEPPGSSRDSGLPLAKRPEAPRAGSAYAAPMIESTGSAPPKPSLPTLPAEAALKHILEAPQAEPPQIEKSPSKQPDAPNVAPALPENKAPENKPTRVAKAEPVAPLLPDASPTSPAGFTFKDCDFCPPLVVVPKGEFQMGSNERAREKPAHKVRISQPFAIGQYEVTYGEWNRCVDAGSCRYRPDHLGSPNDAIGNLSWDDANTYLKWMSENTGQIYRLPSEAEWEYAARAGSANKGQTSTVEPGQQNSFGLHDTAGKMAEWVQDCWNESYQGAPGDGSAWAKGKCSLRGLRGGSFGNTSRFRYDSDVRYEANGFRVVRELH